MSNYKKRCLKTIRVRTKQYNWQFSRNSIFSLIKFLLQFAVRDESFDTHEVFNYVKRKDIPVRDKPFIKLDIVYKTVEGSNSPDRIATTDPPI